MSFENLSLTSGRDTLSENSEKVPQTHLEKTQELIKYARVRVEHEFEISGNTWMSCFRTDLAALTGKYFLALRTGEISQTTFNDLDSVFEEINAYQKKLSNKYTTQSDVPSEEEKETLFRFYDRLLGIQSIA